jgi:hypothetical protein
MYFFSNIEIGSGFANPHLHVQVWHDDLKAIMAIRKKIIKEFGLVAKRCKITLPKSSGPKNKHNTGPLVWSTQKQGFRGGPNSNDICLVHSLGPLKNSGPNAVLKGEPQQQPKYYTYVIKDYSADLSDNEVWNIEQTKKRMRNKVIIKDGLKIKLNVRFISQSKGKYTQKLYKTAYHIFGVLRANADNFLDKYLNKLFKLFIIKFFEFIFYFLPEKTKKKKSIYGFIPRKNKRGVDINSGHKVWGCGHKSMSFWMCAPACAPPFC